MIKKSMKTLCCAALLIAGVFTVACSGSTTPSSTTDNGLSHEEGGSINHDDGDAIAYFLCEEMCNYYDETVKLVFYPNNKFALRATILDTIIKAKTKDDDNYECELYGQRYDKYRGTYEGDPTKDGKLTVNFTEKSTISIGPDEGTYTTVEEAFTTAEWHMHIEYEPYENTTADIAVTIKDDVAKFSNGPISYYEFTRTDSEDLGPYHYDGVPRRQNNNKRTEWSIPEGYTSVASSCFCRSSSAESDYYKYLKTVHLPSTIKKIGSSAFNNCTGLEEINIPSACKVIESKAFYNCVSLKEITIPKNIEKIGEGAFGKKSNNSYSSEDEEEEEGEVPSILVAKFADGITEIPDSIFYSGYYSSGKTLLKKIIIPEGVKVIGESAFKNLDVVEPIVIPESVQTIKDYAFYGLKYKNLVLPEGLESIGREAFYLYDYYSSSDSDAVKGIEILELPSSLKEIGYRAFNFSYLKTLKYGGTLPGLQELKKTNLNFYTGSSMTSTIICNSEDVTDFYKHEYLPSYLADSDSRNWKNATDTIELVLNHDKTYSLKNGSSTETGCFFARDPDYEDKIITFYPVTGKKKSYVYTYNENYEDGKWIYTLDITGLGILTSPSSY